MEAIGLLKSAAGTDPGLQREVNEDRYHVDVARGLFIVVDGVGGQAAGGKAADVAVSMLRARLERETGPLASRLREAITVANNEIYRLAGTRAAWHGMACVLTAAVVRGANAIVGHVGDTRLYKIRQGRIEKVTRDHSPVGEREDARELSELQAMQHPRRNEVYRDVGSEPHEPADPDFIDVHEVAFEPDAALLLCSDGLTDLVDSASIAAIVKRAAGRPQVVVRDLIDAANEAGGKDNVTVVYVEGEQFAPTVVEAAQASEITRRLNPVQPRPPKRRRAVRFTNIVLIAVLILLTFVQSDRVLPPTAPIQGLAAVADSERIVVQSSESIADALARARSGSIIMVQPGEYREHLTLKSGVHIVSEVPKGATIRLPGSASERAAAVVANDITGASLTGFRIVGDSATPLGTGISAVGSELTISDVEITGAKRAAIDVGRGSTVRVIASDIHGNPGAALALRAGAAATISHNTFMRNGTSTGGQRTLALDDGASASFTSNSFVGGNPGMLSGSAAARAAFARNNWFPREPPAASVHPARGR